MVSDMQKTGTIKVVASTGGLKVFDSEDWINPADKVTAEGLDYLKSLNKKKVIITLNDKGKYTKVDEDTGENREIPTYPANEQKSAPQSAKTDYEIKSELKQTSIVRQTCLKAAAETIKAGIFPMPTEGYSTVKEIEDIVTGMAAKFEEWVNRK
jgi:hypothetical protein